MAKVPYGFMAVPKEGCPGEYIPFLIKVREQEIIWKNYKESNLGKIIERFTGKTAGRYDIVPVHHSYRLNKNGWFCTVDQDGLAVLTKSIPIDNHFSISEDLAVLTYRNVDLPFVFINNEDFSVQVTKNSVYDEVTVASTNVLLNTASTWQYSYVENNKTINKNFTGYKDFGLQLVSPVFKFHSDFALMDACTKSKLMVMVRGYIPFIE